MTEKYSRQISLNDFGNIAQQRLINSSVMLIGVGGVGSAILPLLVGSGVGRIKIFDCDKVSISNLHRQTLYGEVQIGKDKVDCAKERSNLQNSDVKIITQKERITTAEDLAEDMSDYDLCIDATDNFATRILINKAARFQRKNLIMASAEGYISQNIHFGNDFYLDNIVDASASSEGSQGRAIFAPSAHLSGVIAAGDAIRILAGVEKIEIGKLISFNFLTKKMSVFYNF